MHKDGSAEELLREGDFSKFIDDARKDPLAAVMKSADGKESGYAGTTILRPFKGKRAVQFSYLNLSWTFSLCPSQPGLLCPAYPFLSFPVLSCPFLSFPVLSGPVLSCPVRSCPVLPCHTPPFSVMLHPVPLYSILANSVRFSLFS